MMNKQTMLESFKLIALCIIIVCLIVMTVVISNIPNVEQKKQLETTENELNQSKAEAQVLAEIEVTAHIRERELLMTNGYYFGWAAVQEQIGEYNRWVVEKQAEVTVLGERSPYYNTRIMELQCITGWGVSTDGVTQ